MLLFDPHSCPVPTSEKASSSNSNLKPPFRPSFRSRRPVKGPENTGLFTGPEKPRDGTRRDGKGARFNDRDMKNGSSRPVDICVRAKKDYLTPCSCENFPLPHNCHGNFNATCHEKFMGALPAFPAVTIKKVRSVWRG